MISLTEGEKSPVPYNKKKSTGGGGGGGGGLVHLFGSEERLDYTQL